MIFTCSRRTSASRSRRRSSRALFVYKSVSIRPASLRAPRSVAGQRGLFALRFKWGRRRGQTKRRERGSSGSAAPRRRQRKKKKKPFGELFGSASRRRRRKRTLASSFNLMSRYLSSLSKLSAPTGFGFPSYAWCTRYYRRPPRMALHDDGERREGLERLRLVSRDDGATARREGMCGQRGAGGASGSYAATRAMRACARRRGISLVGSSSLKAFRPTAVEGIVVRPGGAYHVRFCFGARDAAGLLARGATLRSEREGRGRANGAITGRRGTSATLRALE